MKTKFLALMIFAIGTGIAAGADGRWERPQPTRCDDKAIDSYCNVANYCVNSSADYCIAHVGSRASDESGGQHLLEGCFQRTMHECIRILNPGSGSTSTNPTDLPKPWNCMTNKGNRVSDRECRVVNYCFDIGAKTCSDKVGSDKFTSEGQARMRQCNHELDISCMRALR